jgi:hypothetical protein
VLLLLLLLTKPSNNNNIASNSNSNCQNGAMRPHVEMEELVLRCGGLVLINCKIGTGHLTRGVLQFVGWARFQLLNTIKVSVLRNIS